MKKFIYLLSIALAVIVSTANGWAEDNICVVGDTTSGVQGSTGVIVNNGVSFTHSQMIYSSTSLSSLTNNEITKITFYSSQSTEVSWGDLSSGTPSSIELRIGTCNETSFASGTFIDATDFTTVFTGNIIRRKDKKIEFELSQPFVYESGNLIIDCNYVKNDGKNTSSSWLRYTSETNMAIYKNGTLNETTCNSPVIKFTYQDVNTCSKPTDVSVGAIGTTTATATWQQGGGNLNGNMSV